MRTQVLASVFAIALGAGFVTATAQEAKPAKDNPPPPAGVKTPAGFKAAAGTAAEPYTQTGWAKEIVHEPTGMVLLYMPAGEFLMGSPAAEVNREKDETQHPVTLTKGFYLGKCEVTQGQWEAVMGHNPSSFKTDGKNAPVETVSWDDCQEFIKKLNAALPAPSSTPPLGFRLPSEAEWEYACRASTKGPYYGLDLAELAWHKENSGNSTHPVGQKKPNYWGLYDMHGNVWEWCTDWYSDYPAGAATDPTGPGTGSFRVLRGGSCSYRAWFCRSAGRFRLDPGFRDYFLGCRLAFTPAAE